MSVSPPFLPSYFLTLKESTWDVNKVSFPGTEKRVCLLTFSEDPFLKSTRPSSPRMTKPDGHDVLDSNQRKQRTATRAASRRQESPSVVLFKNLFFNWGKFTVALQCADVCNTAMQMSHNNICISLPF